MGQGRSCSSCSNDTFGNRQIDLNEMLQEADTGDIILFSNPFFGTKLLQWATDSKWDHVGMILKYSNNPLETIIIESAGCGVFICYARDRLIQCLEDKDPSIIGWRRLGDRKFLNPQWKKLMHREAERLIDTPYERNFSDFVKAWIGEDEAAKYVLSSFGGSLGEGATKGEDLDSLFCSELCAYMLKFGALMEPTKERDSNAYAPRDFASQTNSSLTLKKQFYLEQEKQVLTRLKQVTDEEANIQKVHHSGQGASPTESGGPIKDAIAKSAASKAQLERTAIEHAIRLIEPKAQAGDVESQKTLASLQARLTELPDPTHKAIPS